jgi:hypothetical protein
LTVKFGRPTGAKGICGAGRSLGTGEADKLPSNIPPDQPPRALLATAFPLAGLLVTTYRHQPPPRSNGATCCKIHQYQRQHHRLFHNGVEFSHVRREQWIIYPTLTGQKIRLPRRFKNNTNRGAFSSEIAHCSLEYVARGTILTR